jgi:hypothetical protein
LELFEVPDRFASSLTEWEKVGRGRTIILFHIIACLAQDCALATVYHSQLFMD